MLSYHELISLIIPILGLIDNLRYINKIHTGLGEIKQKKCIYSLLNLKMISFVLFPQASQPKYEFLYAGIGLLRRRFQGRDYFLTYLLK